MNRIVRENYPVANLPEDLREGFAPDEHARILVEAEKIKSMPISELLELRPTKGMTREEILAQIDELRGEFDE